MIRMRCLLAVGVCAVLAISSSAMAVTNNEYTFTITQDDLSDEANFATSEFGYDWDANAPLDGTTSPQGYESSSWAGSITKDGATDADRYTSLRINLTAIFGYEVTLSDLASISYYTKLTSGSSDWQIKIYTVADGDDDDSSWYGMRLNSYYTSAVTAHDWTQFDTDDDLTFTSTSGGSGSLTDLISGNGYGSEAIMYIDIILGYMTGSFTAESQLDGIVITLANGDSATINLEATGAAVPEPMTMLAIGSALAGLGGYIRRRRKA